MCHKNVADLRGAQPGSDPGSAAGADCDCGVTDVAVSALIRLRSEERRLFVLP
jgi:hypothetical protein